MVEMGMEVGMEMGMRVEGVLPGQGRERAATACENKRRRQRQR